MLPTLEYTYISSVKIWLRKFGSLGAMAPQPPRWLRRPEVKLGTGSAAPECLAPQAPQPPRWLMSMVGSWLRSPRVPGPAGSEYMGTSKKRKFDALWDHLPRAQQSLYNQAPLYLY